GMIWHNNVYIF
nr:immunoglobulin light chain junction region [Macaca mulatta]